VTARKGSVVVIALIDIQMYASRNKAELVNSTAYSLVNYEE
jgi:hypothetical protein